MDKNTFSCRSAALVTDHPLEDVMASPTWSLFKNKKNDHLAIVVVWI
jgi:hypothetical protein